jgi:hypothetical protein
MLLDVLDDGLDVDWRLNRQRVQRIVARVALTDHAPVKVLHPTLLGDIARHAEVEEDVVKVGVLVGLEAAQHDKAPAVMDSLRGLDETGAQIRKWECGWADVVRAEVTRERWLLQVSMPML